MTFKLSDYDKGQYLNAGELKKLDPPLRVTIQNITEEEVRDPRTGQLVKKVVVRFNELDEDQGVILNKTNNRKLRDKYSDDPAECVGKPVILALEDTPMGEGIRLRFPDKPAKKPSNIDKFGGGSVGKEIDDDLPDALKV
jgi:hypothetical protein